MTLPAQRASSSSRTSSSTRFLRCLKCVKHSAGNQLFCKQFQTLPVKSPVFLTAVRGPNFLHSLQCGLFCTYALFLCISLTSGTHDTFRLFSALALTTARVSQVLHCLDMPFVNGKFASYPSIRSSDCPCSRFGFFLPTEGFNSSTNLLMVVFYRQMVLFYQPMVLFYQPMVFMHHSPRVVGALTRANAACRMHCPQLLLRRAHSDSRFVRCQSPVHEHKQDV